MRSKNKTQRITSMRSNKTQTITSMRNKTQRITRIRANMYIITGKRQVKKQIKHVDEEEAQI
jgi:hypothetical protein